MDLPLPLLASLLRCEHPLGRHLQVAGSGVGCSVVLQACADCGAHRVLPGQGGQAWQRPMLVEQAAVRAAEKAGD